MPPLHNAQQAATQDSTARANPAFAPAAQFLALYMASLVLFRISVVCLFRS
jgi:hypothetical protein